MTRVSWGCRLPACDSTPDLRIRTCEASGIRHHDASSRALAAFEYPAGWRIYRHWSIRRAQQGR